MKSGSVVADVSQREEEIGSELDLVFQVPRSHHRRAPEGRRYVVDSLAVRLGGIDVWSGRQHGQPGIHLRTRKRISGKQGLVGGESLQRSLAEVGIDQGPVVKTCAAAKDVVVHG